jgi:hypothetical protein
VHLLMREVNHRAKNMLSDGTRLPTKPPPEIRKISSIAFLSASSSFLPIRTYSYGTHGPVARPRTSFATSPHSSLTSYEDRCQALGYEKF